MIRNSLKLAAFFVLCSCISQSEKSSEANKPDDRGYIVKIGQDAPNFSTIRTDSSKFTLADHRGNVVMLQFTASWCGVCRKEMPHIEKDIWLPLKHKGFILVGIDRGEPFEKVVEFAEKMQITYPLALDEDSKILRFTRIKAQVLRAMLLLTKMARLLF